MAVATKQSRTDTGPQIILPEVGSQRARVPQIAVGLLLTAGAALAFVLWNAASVQRTPVLALISELARGEAVELTDLRIVHVGTDDALAMLGADQASQILGRVAVADLPAGSLVVPEQFAVRSTLVPGTGVVGLAMSAGEYPTPRLRLGDLVNVVVASSEDGSGRVLVEAAEVVGVEALGTQGQRFVSLLMAEDTAAEVAAMSSSGRLRLVQIAREDAS